jgi:hypothetical protein
MNFDKLAELAVTEKNGRWVFADALLTLWQQHKGRMGKMAFCTFVQDELAKRNHTFANQDLRLRLVTVGAWPADKRNLEKSWTLHRELRNNKDRFTLIMREDIVKKSDIPTDTGSPNIGGQYETFLRDSFQYLERAEKYLSSSLEVPDEAINPLEPRKIQLGLRQIANLIGDKFIEVQNSSL